MRKLISLAAMAAVLATTPSFAQVDKKASSAKQAQTKGELAIPHCTRRIGHARHRRARHAVVA